MNDTDETEEIDEGRLIAVGNVLRATFIAEKCELLGRKWRMSNWHDRRDHWRNVARQCILLNADPQTYVRAAFVKCNMQAGPFASMLSGKTAASWYRSYVSGPGSKGYDIQKDNEPLVNAVYRKELSDALKAQRQTLKNMNGTWLPNEANVEWLLRYSSPVPLHIRTLICYPAPLLRERYGNSAYSYFAKHPHIVHAAKQLGFPMDDILLWLSQPTKTTS